METNSSPKVCGVCQEDYDEEERCPRILGCSHTFCNSCIEKLVSNNRKRCPFCRRTFVAGRSDDVMVNYAALDFIRYLAERDINSRPSKRDPSTSLSSKIDKLKKETLETIRLQAVSCQEAEQHMERTIEKVKDLVETITKETTRIEKDILPKIQETVSHNSTTLEELKQTMMQFQNKMKEIKSQKENLENMKHKIETTRAETFKDVGGLLDEADEVNTSVSICIDDFELNISEQENYLETKRKRAKRVCDKSDLILDLLSSAEECEEDIESNLGDGAMDITESSSSEQRRERPHDFFASGNHSRETEDVVFSPEWMQPVPQQAQTQGRSEWSQQSTQRQNVLTPSTIEALLNFAAEQNRRN